MSADEVEFAEAGIDESDGWCLECGDPFHLDDCGGYNPPCYKCGLCRDCCRTSDFGCDAEREDDEDYPDVVFGVLLPEELEEES